MCWNCSAGPLGSLGLRVSRMLCGRGEFPSSWWGGVEVSGLPEFLMLG